MTVRPRPENLSEFFVEWQIVDGSDGFIDLSIEPGEAAARLAEQGEVTAASPA